MANKRKRSRKENKAIHAKKKRGDFDIWKHQRVAERKLRGVQKRNPKGLVWEGYTAAETKKHARGKRDAFLPEF